MAFSAFKPFKTFHPFRGGDDGKIIQPRALTKDDTETVFITGEGKLLVRGTRRVRPQENS